MKLVSVVYTTELTSLVVSDIYICINLSYGDTWYPTYLPHTYLLGLRYVFIYIYRRAA